ncbi:MAG: hypothetical protein H7138_10110, partial [Myxococcales bacterium]|nr:hypothetical protein [Myxococcales bacterium]
GALALVLASVWARRKRAPIDPDAQRILVGWTIGCAVVGVALTRVPLAFMSYDSHFIVMMGGTIAQDGGFAPDMLARLGDYGIFTVLAQSLVGMTPESYLWALTPMIAVSTIATFAVMLDHGLAELGVRRRHVWVALLTAATFSSFMLVRHAFYIQTNLGTAAYLFVFCSVFWWSETTGKTDALPIAFLALFAVGLHRIEGPAVGVLFAILAILPSRLPRKQIAPQLALSALAIAGWYLLLARGVSADSEFLTPNKCLLMASIPVVFAAYVALTGWARIGFLARIDRAAPLIVVVVLVLALIGGFAVRYELMAGSFHAWRACLLWAPYWQGPWEAIIALGLLGLLVPAAPHRALFVVGVPAYFAVILLLVLGRTPYYVGLGDSASRMAIHLVPLAFFYFGLKFIPLLPDRAKS